MNRKKKRNTKKSKHLTRQSVGTKKNSGTSFFFSVLITFSWSDKSIFIFGKTKTGLKYITFFFEKYFYKRIDKYFCLEIYILASMRKFMSKIIIVMAGNSETSVQNLTP